MSARAPAARIAHPRRAAAGSVPHLYVHYPFCAKKCPYCDFNSHANREAESEAYVDGLLAEARSLAEGLEPRTIFVGGGTPTHAEPALLERYLSGVRDVVGDRRLEEWTVEANPGTLTDEKVAAMARSGVTRVSVGVQSFADRHLVTLGRIHDGGQASRAVREVRGGGIARVSLDLILATPGQTLAEQREDLERAVSLSPDHVSAYVLTIEEGTAFASWVKHGLLAAPEEDRDLEHLRLARAVLEEAGLARYEVSNFARPGHECRHNLGYWRNAEWLGIGAGAHSHVRGRRWRNESDPARYARAVAERGDAVVAEERPDAATALFETIMMGLRLSEGVDLDAARRATGIDARTTFAAAISRHAGEGLLVLDGSRLRLTDRGFELASYVTRSFL